MIKSDKRLAGLALLLLLLASIRPMMLEAQTQEASAAVAPTAAEM